MSNVRFVATLSAFALGLMACAQTPQVEGTPTPARTAGTSGGVTVWSGNINSVTESNADVRQSGRGNGYGTAQMTKGEGGASTRVTISFSAGGASDRYLNWAILQGRCGSGTLPVLPINNFPELQVGGDGRAQVTATLPFEFPARGDYHINIYHERGQTLDQVIACGNLRASGG